MHRIIFTFLILFINNNSLFAHADFEKMDFSHIDNHADKAPVQLKRSIPSLVNYLVGPTENDVQKVRAIFRWISQNIDYDIDAFFNERLREEDPMRVIRNGKAVCGGYSILFKTMCLEAGIKCEVIPGWSKGYSEQITMQANHAWNSVIINNRPYLLDVTWGAGYIDDQARFKKSFNTHYFLTDPEQFIYDHLPEEEYWQLKKNPISRSAFKDLMLLHPAFFKTGLELLSHKNSNIIVQDELLITIRAPLNTYISAQILYGDGALPENYLFTQRQKDVFELNVHFPKSGKYTLRIFSKIGNNPNEIYDWACDYKIDARKNSIRNPFVVQYSAFSDLNGYLDQPVDLILSKGIKQDFKMQLDNAREVSIFQNEKLTPFSKSGNSYSGSFYLYADTVRVIARTDSSNYYHYLLEYIAR